jgi:sensor histidine kinase YesM
MKSDWNGFVIDSSQKNIKKLKNSYYFWKYDLQTFVAFININNINELLIKSGFDRDLGILSIDIDGNDYHILNKIDCFDPRIIICEFNPLFGNDRKITVPYDPKFYRTRKHYSNLYWGASINALRSLLTKQDYTLVGTGMQGGNAYFIKNSLMTDHLRILAKNPFCFNFNWRESRDINGNLNFLRAELRYKEIKGMNVLNVETGNLEKL